MHGHVQHVAVGVASDLKSCATTGTACLAFFKSIRLTFTRIAWSTSGTLTNAWPRSTCRGRRRFRSEELRHYWDGVLGILQVDTPDIHTNRMVNIWNAYQCMATFNMSRSASLPI